MTDDYDVDKGMSKVPAWDGDAMFQLGCRAAEVGDTALADSWWEKAALAGSAEAIYN